MGAVEVVVDPPLGWVYFNRPDKLNAMNLELLREAEEAVRSLGGRSDVSFIVFSGRGRAFSAGIDLREVSSGGVEGSGRLFEALASFFRALLTVDKVTVAAVNGVAAGGGAEVLWAVDLSVAVRGARLIWAEALWGLIPPALTTVGLGALGPGRAAFIAMAAGEMTAEEAYRLGIVSALADTPEELPGAVRRLAEQVMRSSPEAVASIRRIIRLQKAGPLLELGVSELLRLARREETLRAAESFAREKKPPRYKWPGSL
jgi:enoyl-CoA hydratase/carnithine racemase